jgi:hypothetical protein
VRQFAIKVAWHGEAAERFGPALDGAGLESPGTSRDKVQGEDFEQAAIEALGVAS